MHLPFSWPADEVPLLFPSLIPLFFIDRSDSLYSTALNLTLTPGALTPWPLIVSIEEPLPPCVLVDQIVGR